ncbi:MAG: hypothetical protein ACOCUI_01465 [bacterium]
MIELNTKNKAEVFKEEIDMITTKEVKDFIRKSVDLFPDYFWIENHISPYPNSNSNGLIVDHTKKVIKLLDEMLIAYDSSDVLRDIAIAAAIIHEGWVRGESNNKDVDPFYNLYPRKKLLEKQYNLIIPEGIWRGIMDTIEGHLGEFTVIPKIKPQKGNPAFLLHLADFLVDNKNVDIMV